MQNLILIGMPASGKSTLGQHLAELLGLSFLDTDDVLAHGLGMPLQDYINEAGIAAFLAREEEAVLSIEATGTVIATGGSVVYSKAAMDHLKKTGLCIFLSVPFSAIVERLSNLETRGVAIVKGKSLRELYEERCPLYLQAADLIFREGSEEGDLSIEDHARRLLLLLGEKHITPPLP